MERISLSPFILSSCQESVDPFSYVIVFVKRRTGGQ